MALDVTKKYNAFPSDLDSLEKKKTEEYGMDYANAIWAVYTLNYPVNNPQMLQYLTNRQFAEGTYPSEIYKNRLGLNGDTSYLNLDFESINRIPTIVDNMVGMACNKIWRFQCNPTDTVSRTRFDDYRAQVEADMFLKKHSDGVEKLTGMPLVPKGKFVPEDDEEKELHLQMNFKLDEAEAMELALKWVFDSNNFDKDSIPLLYRDIFTDKKTAIFRYYDGNKNLKVERWDHLRLITPYSVYEDFRNIPYQALMFSYTLGEIAKINTTLTDEDLYNIAKMNCGSSSTNGVWNPDWYLNYGAYFNAYGGTALRQFQNFNITVLNFYFLSPISTSKAVKVTKNGRVRLETVGENYPNEKGREIINKKKIVRFEGFWIPNTKYIWDYKMSENVEREPVKGGYSPEVELPCQIIMPNLMGMRNKSFVQRMIPLEKQLVLAWLKLQQFLIKAKPPGMAINQNALLDIVQGMGDGKTKPIDWTNLYEQTGNIIFTDRDAAGNQVNIPFKELEGGISPAFRDFIAVQDYCINKMNEVIGYNTAVDASSPKADALVGTQEMAQQATYNCLRPLYISVTNLIDKSGKRVSLMIQDSLRLGNEGFREALTEAIGKYNVDVLTTGRDTPLSSSAISVETAPDEKEMASVEGLITLGIQTGSLTTSDVLRVRQQLKTNIKLAGQLLSYLEQKNSKDKQKQAIELSQQNSQVQIQSAQAANQSQAQLDAILTENKIKVIQAQHAVNMEEIGAKGNIDLSIRKLTNDGIETVAAINSAKAENVQQSVNQGKLLVEHIKHESGMQKEHVKHESAINQIALEAAVTPKPEIAKK